MFNASSSRHGSRGVRDHFSWVAALLLVACTLSSIAPAFAGERPPNFVVIFCDDLGYGDLGCYGSEANRTPHVDGLAAAGMRFTDFYSSSPVCTPSRASLLTGCYPRRVGMHEDATGHWVLIPRSRRGLDPGELTLAEALKPTGYATACIGKWHLGDQPEHLPTRHGFDLYFGIPYSNDMQNARRGDPPLPLVVGNGTEAERVVEAPADQSTLTKRYTERAIAFIEEHRDQPFLVYLPHTFPHLPLFASDRFRGRSENGRYGDAVEEIDWSTGEILACLDRLDLANETLVVFTSDNGSNGRNGGSNAPLAGAKGSTMEGGMRVPMIVRWPGHVPAGAVCREVTTTMDLLPTFCRMAGVPGPERPIDGHDIGPLLRGEKGATSPYEALFYYRRRQLQAVRTGRWKYHLPLTETHPQWTSPEPTGKGRPGKLIDLDADLVESKDVSAEHPGVVERLRRLAAAKAERLGNDADRGHEQREPRTLSQAKPLRLE